jgi:cytochrome c biogenesis protein
MSVAQVPSARKSVRNVGPSVRFTVRDSQGQATEYQNYMQPLPLEGRLFFLSGARASPAEPFRYLRFPADEKGGLDGYMNLRAVLFDDSAYAEIARRFSASALQGERVDPALRARFTDSTQKVLRLFASGGYDAMARFVEKAVPQAERDQAVQTYLRVLEGAAFEAYRLSRQRAGLPDAAPDESSQRFVRDSLNAVSDSFFYGFPVYFQLASYEQVQASGLQLTRSPGRNVVYFGSLLLTVGVFLMFYIRERRAWLLVKPASGDVLFAFSGNRRTLDFEREFARHRDALAALVKESSWN